MASLPSAVSGARIKSDYGEELKDFAEWYFQIFPTLVASGDARLSLFKKANPPQYFEFQDKIKYVEHMEREVDNNIVFTFILYKRDNHFWPRGQKGKAFFDHLRSGLKLRLEDISSNAAYYSRAAEINIKNFYGGLEKNLADKAKLEGWENKSCSSVPWLIYEKMCAVLILKDVEHWLMFILQWNLMSRSIDIAKINISALSFSKDMLTLEFSHEKTARKKNEKATTVHIASNPNNPIVCPVLAFAVNFCCRNMDSLRLFDGSSIQQHYGNAVKWALQHSIVQEELKHLGLTEAKVATHTLRKSAATHAAGGTDGTPMHFTILLRGGWSIGNVLDRYFSLAENGDRVLANLLAGREYFSKEFARLIPHFKRGSNIKSEVLRSIYCGKYVEDHFEELEGVLHIFTAQLVYHNATLKKILDKEHKLCYIMDRNLLHAKSFQDALGPEFESKNSTFKATGQGGAVIYHRLDAIESSIRSIENFLMRGQFGVNPSRNECNQLMIEIAKIKETQVSNFQNLQRDIRTAMSADTTNVIPVSLNVFVHHTQNKKVWKVSKDYNFPANFQELATQYIFSNKKTCQTALRECLPSNVYYNNPGLSPEENARRKKQFSRHYSKCILAVQVFLQYASCEFTAKFNDLTKSFYSIDPWSRGAKWNELFSVAFKKFSQEVLATNSRKRKLNQLNGRTIYNAISKKRGALKKTFISSLRERCALPPAKKSTAMQWSFKLPQIRLAEEEDNKIISPMMIDDDDGDDPAARTSSEHTSDTN